MLAEDDTAADDDTAAEDDATESDVNAETAVTAKLPDTEDRKITCPTDGQIEVVSVSLLQQSSNVVAS